LFKAVAGDGGLYDDSAPATDAIPSCALGIPTVGKDWVAKVVSPTGKPPLRTDSSGEVEGGGKESKPNALLTRAPLNKKGCGGFGVTRVSIPSNPPPQAETSDKAATGSDEDPRLNASQTGEPPVKLD